MTTAQRALLWLAFVALLGGCRADSTGAASASGERARAVGDAVRVATWNVRRFFDDRCDSGECSSGSFESAPAPGDFASRARDLAAGVGVLDADVVLLQEVETQRALDAVVDLLDGDWPTRFVAETGAAGSLDVAVLARWPTTATRLHRDTVRLTRPDGSRTWLAHELPEVHLDVGGRPLIVVAAHFKSRRNDDPGRRLAEAGAAAGIVAAAAAAGAAPVVFGGDLNDEPGSPPLSAFEAETRFLRVAAELSERAGATYRFSGRDIALDHLYSASEDYVQGSAAVFRADNSGFRTSDHGALRAEFRLR